VPIHDSKLAAAQAFYFTKGWTAEQIEELSELSS